MLDLNDIAVLTVPSEYASEIVAINHVAARYSDAVSRRETTISDRQLLPPHREAIRRQALT